ncbi:MAG: MBL fold metallo-hydrolase, partial [Mesorhizobium sp.]|nr:MBL fold metallo-hydrolase [Mesorhizobium sp.]
MFQRKNKNTEMRRMSWKVGKVKITQLVELETVGSTRFI